MKYAAFFLALFAMPPLGVALSFNRRWMKYAVWAMIGALAAYQATAINFFSYEEYRGSSRGMEVSVAYLMALALLVAAAIKGRLPKPIPSFGAFLYVVYFLLCLPSYATAENMLFSWMETWKMVMLYLVYLSVRAYLNTTENARSLVNGLAVFAIWNFLLVVKDHFCGVYQPHGAFPHQNGLAMAMHVFANMFFAHVLVNGWKRSWLGGFAFIAASACIVRTYSRGAIAMMPISFLVTFALSFMSAAHGRKMGMIGRVVPVAAIGLVGLCLMLPRIVERFAEAPEASKNTRIELALCAKEMILDEPWRGVGINNWGIKINPPYEYAERAGRKTNRGEDFKDGIVETVYLLVGAECGIPALAAMIAWFASYLFLCLSLARKFAGTPYAAIPAGLAGGFVACYLQSCLEWVLRQQMNLILLMMFFALLDHLAANAARLGNEPKTKGSGIV
ncbi:MAG: O-antigen ligase family protein [Kiritimatiellae bacterium]|nr:O-antigen ligase family protein [Kiritimatiellia bacterium]